nr:ABC transporter permease [uncultured Draconibacterium sp.]
MIKLFLKNILRGLFSKKSFTPINIAGLCIGITIFFMLFVYVLYENSYDKFIPDSENIYRVELDMFRNGKLLSEKASSTYNIGSLLKDEIPQVKGYARAGFEKCLIYREDVSFNSQDLFWVDSTFLNTVNVKMLQGDASTALAAPYTAVLSEDMAHKLFGKQDPVGQMIYVNENLKFIVNGVFESLPHNSHFNFNLLLSLSTGDVLWPGWGTQNRSWTGESWLYTYVKLENGVDAEVVEQKMNEKVTELFPKELLADNYSYKYHLKKIEDIHLTSHLENEFKINGSEKNTNTLFFISFLIIITVWINFINISSSEAFEKAKEIGIRKVNGATKWHIVFQFLAEVFIINLISLLFTFILIQFCFGIFESIFDVPIKHYLNHHLYLYLYLLLIVVTGTLLSGIYPALIMANFNPHKVLKGSVLSGKRNFSLRKSLLIFQLSVSIALLVSVITIYKQINYINTTDIGFNKDFVLAIKAPCTLNMDSSKYRKYLHFKNEILTLPSVKAVTASSYSMGEECLSTILYNQLNGNEIPGISCKINNIDEDYINTYNIRLLGGSNFALTQSLGEDKVIINKVALKALGFDAAENVIGSYLSVSGQRKTKIVGVLDNFNQESLKSRIEPMVFFYNHPNNFGTYSVLLQKNSQKNIISQVRAFWKKEYPNAPFDYLFVDEQLDSLYKSEQRFGQLLVLFAFLTIVIAGLGLIGLIIIVTRKKIKEIGVRKVNGAKTSEVMVLLNKDFLKWVTIAFVIATPVAWYAMNKWLENFAYKTTLSWWIFALAGLLALGIVLLTVSWQSWRAATRNPVEALRYE